jgi:hypothetical protein
MITNQLHVEVIEISMLSKGTYLALTHDNTNVLR